MKLGNMFRLLLGTAGLRFGGAAIGLATQLVLARLLSPQDLGIVFLTMSSAALLSLLVTAGYPNLAFTQLPRWHTLKVQRAVAAFHGAFLRDFVLWNVALIGVVLALAWSGSINPDLRLALLFGTASAGISGLLRYNSAIANGLKQFVIAYGPDSLVRPGLFFLIIVAVAGAGIELSLMFVLCAFIASNFVVVVGQALAMGTNRLRVQNWFHARRGFSSLLRGRAAAVMITAGLATMFADIVTLLGGVLLAPGDVAVLGICIRLSGLAGYVLQASQQFSLPDLTAAFTRRDDALARSLLLRLNYLMLGSSAVMLSGTILLGGIFLRFFGDHYATGYGLLVICMLGQVVRAASGMNQNLLAIHGFQKQTARAALTAVVLFVGTTILLGARMGAFGIGLAVLVAELAWAAQLAAQARSLVGKRADLLWLMMAAAP